MVKLSAELAELFTRDLGRLSREIAAFPSDDLFGATLPGVENSAGNLILHLEGNLREYIGRQLGGVPYQRERSVEFGVESFRKEDLAARADALHALIPPIITNLSENVLETPFPENVLGRPLPARQFLIHLHGHFNYHLGQIDYLRRILTQSGPVRAVRL